MKSLTIIVGIITLMFGCAILPKNYVPIGHNYTSNNDGLACKDLYQNIAKKWGYHQVFKSCYYYNKKLISTITQNQDCFIGLSDMEIIQVFGIPTTTNGNKLIYNISKNCSEIDTLFASRSLKFILLDKKVVEVEFQEADVHY